jgi:alpha-tubulin suppressor-like RCC1 family protein
MKKNLLNPILIATLAIFSLSNAVKAQTIAAGMAHSLFLCSDSKVWAWGSNAYGNLGDGTTTTTNSNPVQVVGITGIISIAAGERHSLFLKNDGTVWASGFNGNGQLGDGTTTQRNTPVQVLGLTGIISIAASGWQSLFLKNDGTAWACGFNMSGQLGDGTTTQRNIPVQVSGLTSITSIASGSFHSLFVKNDGTAWACGSNGTGQLGDGTTTQKTSPVQVSGLTGITSIAGGEHYSLFVKNDGTAWACGKNGNGQLGDGTTTQRNTPVQISGLTGITSISTGFIHSLFLKNDGTVWACGFNGLGQLGDGTTTQRLTPIQVSELTGITSIAAAGSGHSLFQKNNGTAWACGKNNFGQLGDGNVTLFVTSTPGQVIGLCGSTSAIQENSMENLVSVYPNPTNGNVQFSVDKGPIQHIKIYNPTGVLVYQSEKETKELNLTGYPKGVYLIQIQSADKIISKRVVIQ